MSKGASGAVHGGSGTEGTNYSGERTAARARLDALTLAVVVVGSAFAGGVGFVGTAAAANTVSGCTSISSEGTYHLSSDVTDTTQSECIRITASDVTFDGQGNTIDGDDPTAGEAGINVTGAGVGGISNVTVRDVTVTDFALGVRYGQVDRGDVRAVRAIGNLRFGVGIGFASSRVNVTAVNASANDDGGMLPGPTAGIGLGTGVADVNVSDSIVRNNRQQGVFAPRAVRPVLVNVTATGNGFEGILAGHDTTVLRSVARNNGGDGIEVGSGATIDRSTAVGNTGPGFRGVNDSTVADSIARRNGDGFHLSRRNLVTDNHAVNNTGTGFLVNSANDLRRNNATDNGAAGFEAGMLNRFRANDATNNGGTGFTMTAPENVFVDNVAEGNAANGFSAGADNTFDGDRAVNNDNRGFRVLSNTTFVGVTASANSADGIVGTDDVTVTDSIIQRNDGIGVDITSGTVANTLVSTNDPKGIEAADNLTVRDSTVVRNSGAGPGIEAGPDAIVADTTVVGNTDGVEVGDDAFLRNVSTNTNGGYDLRTTGRNLTGQGVTIGVSAVGVTADFTATEVRFPSLGSAPATPSGQEFVGQRFRATNNSGVAGYLNLTLSYTDADVTGVDESTLSLWRYDTSWSELGTGPATDRGTNRLQYNVSDFSLFAPLAEPASTSGGSSGGGDSVGFNVGSGSGLSPTPAPTPAPTTATPTDGTPTRSSTPTETASPTATVSETEDSGTEVTTEADDAAAETAEPTDGTATTTATRGPGFGVTLAVLTVAVLSVWAARYRH